VDDAVAHMATKPLKRWSTDELETAIYQAVAERILNEHERAPERSLTLQR